MVPAGHLLKRVSAPPDWLSSAPVVDIYSVADCVNDNVVDVQTAWRHNGFGVANDQETLSSLCTDTDCESDDTKLFYYEAYEEEIETDGWSIDPSAWRPLTGTPSAGAETCVAQLDPCRRTLMGYDVVVFGDYLEHSPLSCNSIAGKVQVNKHCLFDTLQSAKAAIEAGAFGGGCEPGVYRIFSVSVVDDRGSP
jgi:hypothetical protein